MIKIISLILISFIGYQGWQNVTQVRHQNELRKQEFFKPAQQYLTAIISSVNEDAVDLQFTNFKTKAIIPGRELKGSFDISYIKNESYTDVDIAKKSTEEVSLNSRVHFKAEVELTSVDGEYWTTKILDVKNTAVEFTEPMYISL